MSHNTTTKKPRREGFIRNRRMSFGPRRWHPDPKIPSGKRIHVTPPFFFWPRKPQISGYEDLMKYVPHFMGESRKIPVLFQTKEERDPKVAAFSRFFYKRFPYWARLCECARYSAEYAGYTDATAEEEMARFLNGPSDDTWGEFVEYLADNDYMKADGVDDDFSRYEFVPYLQGLIEEAQKCRFFPQQAP